MNIITLVWHYLSTRPLNTAINILLLSLAIAVITILLLFSNQLEEKISQNSRGIDLVVGAKGSPLQLILCNIFHVDFPTGNIKVREAERISKNRLIKTAVPLALGDSYQSYRIVGTTIQYAKLYKVELEQGEWWKENLDVTIGANVALFSGLKLNDEFESAHGLTQNGHAHNEHHYVVKGVMRKSNSALDNLILTNVESVWQMHEDPNNPSSFRIPKDTAGPASRLIPSISENDSLAEITSLILRYRSPLAAVQLPRLVNSQSSLQAASPAYETARLFSILGVGVDIITGFASILILISALSIFIALYNALKERRYDMAIMRTMGASRSKLLVAILLEGGALTILGSLLGIFFGHATLIALSALVVETQEAGMTGFIFYKTEWIILGGSLLLGLLCALIPAIQAYRTDISTVLAEN